MGGEKGFLKLKEANATESAWLLLHCRIVSFFKYLNYEFSQIAITIIRFKLVNKNLISDSNDFRQCLASHIVSGSASFATGLSPCTNNRNRCYAHFATRLAPTTQRPPNANAQQSPRQALPMPVKPHSLPIHLRSQIHVFILNFLSDQLASDDTPPSIGVLYRFDWPTKASRGTDGMQRRQF